MGTILPSRLRSPFEHTGEAKVALFPRLPLLAEGSCLPQQTEGLPLRGIPVFRSAYFPIPHRPTFGAPVFRSAYSASRNARASAAFAASIRPYHGLFYKTFDLQVRCAHPAGIFAPSQLFELRRCYAWPIFRKEYTVLFSTKRTCFRLAAPCGYRGAEEPHFVEKRKRHHEKAENRPSFFTMNEKRHTRGRVKIQVRES